MSWQETTVRLEGEIDHLRAHVAELRHALEHVEECGACLDCVRVSRGALGYLNYEDFWDQAYEEWLHS